jgi:hypothetical protein
MIGTELFGIKLRCWQALCILSVADLLTDAMVADIAPKYFIILGHNCCNAIRVPMEIWAANVSIKYPSNTCLLSDIHFYLSYVSLFTCSEIMLPMLLQELQNYNLPQAKLSSLFVILGHLAFNTEAFARSLALVRRSAVTISSTSAETTNWLVLSQTLMIDIVQALLPHVTCAAALPRSIAQMLVYVLVPALFTDIGYEPECRGSSDGNERLEREYGSYISLRALYTMYLHMHNNKDLAKSIQRQKQFYEDYRLRDRGTVAGLQSLGFDVGGEIADEHIINILSETYRANAGMFVMLYLVVLWHYANFVPLFSEAEALAARVEAAGINYTATETGNTGSVSESLALQTKIIPFDELHLTVEESLLSRSGALSTMFI